MKLYFIRHAPTPANFVGAMIKNYNETNIINEEPVGWKEKVGCHLPELNIDTPIITSPALRCQQTAKLLFDRVPDIILKELDEFDCSGLGDRKFWEITEEEFCNCVKLNSNDMEKQIDLFFDTCYSLNTMFHNINHIICISHGMVIRYIYHYLTGRKNATPFDIINSKNFKFANLDMLVYDTDTKTIEVYNYKEPIQHEKVG